jgi:nucleoside-diphosphate-sugar epimerase
LKILVTGGGGFLGSSICRQLSKLNHQVIAFQRSPAQHLEAHGIVTTQGDITDYHGLMDAATDCEAIIHTAGKAGVWGDPADYQRINVDGTANVISVCREHAIPILVHTSSPSIVHSGGDIGGADESLPIADHFNSPYPASKAEAEKLVIGANSTGLKTSLRKALCCKGI